MRVSQPRLLLGLWIGNQCSTMPGTGSNEAGGRKLTQQCEFCGVSTVGSSPASIALR